jgi:hypothetical protein
MKKVKYKKRVSPGIFNKVKIIKGKKKFIKYFGTPVILNCDEKDIILKLFEDRLNHYTNTLNESKSKLASL